MAKRNQANLPVNYQEQLAKESEEIAKRIAAPSGDRIRYNGNIGFITPDGQEGNEIEAVIIDFVSVNLFYDRPYDRDNPQPPACFAIGRVPSELAPSPNSPNKQNDICATCPMNQFGSAPNGKGKACKNTRLLALMSTEVLDNPEAEDAQIWTLSIPPTSLKAFDAYVHSLAVKHKTVPIGVVTKLTMDSSSSFAAPRFHVARPLTSEELGIFMPHRDEAYQRITAEPDVSKYTAIPAKGRTVYMRKRGV